MSKVTPAARQTASTVMRYGLAVLCVVAALLVTELLQHLLDGPPWYVLLAAVMISSWVGGFGPGLLAVLLSILAIDYFFVPPLYILTLKIEYLPRLAVFGLSALLVGWLSDRRKRAEAALRQARDELEARVQERAAELTQTNERLREGIAERTRAEEELRERANLLDLTHDTIFVRDMSDAITYWNRGAEELYGWTKEEAIGQVSHQLMQTLFPAPLDAISAELLGKGRWEGGLTHTKRDGTQVVVASRWSLQRDEQGNPIAILETNNDITERRRAEERLRESERRYRNIFQTAGVSIWEEDFSQVKVAIDELKAQGVRDFRQYLAAHPEFVQYAISLVKIIDVNDATVRLFGARSKDELLVSLHAIFTPETQDIFAEELVTIAEWRTSFESETTVQTLKGDKLTVLFTMTFPPQPAKLGSVLVSMMDITERKRAEYLTGQVFESSPDGKSIVGRDYRYQRVNPVYERLWGMPAERIVGMHVADLLGMEVFEQKVKPHLDRCFAGEDVSYGEWFANPLGRRYMAVSCSPLRPDSERVESALVISRDLTEHMLASEALREAQTELAHVTRVLTLGELAASIAHEVNQPLTAVITNGNACLRWITRDPPNLDEAREAVRRMIRDGNRASEVIARIRAPLRKAAPQKTQLAINDVIAEVIALVQSELRRNGVSLRTDLTADLPPVLGDRIQLQQVLLNLLLNGMEAMRTVTDRPRTLIVRSQPEETAAIRVAVEDAGTGIDPQDLERIFTAFFTTKPAGLGMGLPISRSIIEAHGGQLWAAPNLGLGVTVQFTLPTGDESAP